MGKQNIKAGATQVRQDMESAAAAAETLIQESQQAAEQQATDAATEQQQAPEGDAVIQEGVTQEQGTAQGEQPQAGEESNDLVVTPITQVAQAIPVVEKPVVVEAAQPVAPNASTNDQLDVILKNVPAAHQVDITRIRTYLQVMAPKRPVDAKVGVNEQVALYRSIQNIINRQEEYFTQLFTALLFIFKAEGKTGAMSDRYRMRFMDNITLHQGDRKAFANLTQMLHILADAKSREVAMGQVNLEKALENGLTAEGRKRVLDYFGA